MSAERLRAMLSEATSGPWTVALKWGTAADETRVVARGNSWVADCQSHRAPVRNRANARLAAIAPDAIALLADAADFLSPLKWDEHPGLAEWQLRLDALTRSEGVTDAVATPKSGGGR